ncbi:glutathione peroxidase [Bacteriovorax sp. Seq25_V]|uniref:glutathione peroxidase n=1 Tax=Bacteriovorax sp. Seq25_V TaxID=1201288 RepID=UPI00038A500B|nr:glutathione peroxidase [Bacteriovorax sp. Seq25_V]EQC45718.1 glutathione peroxidase [Bacteriovorax sp. Seq25_V]
MIKLFLVIFATLSTFANSLYDFNINTYKGEEIKFSSFKGKPLLVVNIATRCGYTGQLDDIEKLYQKYKSKGLVVLGIPSNDFGGQTPEGNTEVANFCQRNYGATFPITEKQVVSGANKNKIYEFIKSQTREEVKWNFEKVLFDKEGRLIKKYPSSTVPLDKGLINNIEKLL